MSKSVRGFIALGFFVLCCLVVRSTPLSAGPPDDWAGLANNGLNGNVLAIAVDGNNVYIGGEFTQTGDASVTGLNRVARWDGAAWHPLGFGLNGNVKALAVDSLGDVYAGGEFTATCADAACASTTTAVNHIARWDGDAWNAVGSGADHPVRALGIDHDANVYVGLDENDCQLLCGNTHLIAKWDGVGWSSVRFGLYGNEVNALSFDASGNLYAGGNFDGACDSPDCPAESIVEAHKIAKFDGVAWSSLPKHGLNSDVNALAFVGTTLYPGGAFTDTWEGGTRQLSHAPEGSHVIPNIVRYDGTNWLPMPHLGLNSVVYALAPNGSQLFIGGNFDKTDDSAITGLWRIVNFDGTNWNGFPNQGLNNSVRALAVAGNVLYVGGEFTATQDATMALNHIATFPVECAGKPALPSLVKPNDGKKVNTLTPNLKWEPNVCADTFTVVVKNFATGTVASKGKNLTGTSYKTNTLTSGVTYKWFVKACNTDGCAKSETRTFRVK